MAFRFIMSAESHRPAVSQYFHGFNQAGRLPLVIVMPYCATNKFASTKRKLPRDLVISSEAQASAEVAMALIALISRARMQTHPELNRTIVIQPETLRETPVRAPLHEACALFLLLLGIAVFNVS